MDNKNNNSSDNEKTSAKESSIINGMDKANQEALNVLLTKGEKDFIEHIFTGEDGRQLTYAEMRARYG